ncbi:MaoC family dehydratase [Rhodococcoides fascians]|uniref:MaoC family dehydratase n=1 Tax=Rhodococcoides fascians TaxID=1828 RepID=UPI000B00E005|nr:MaoC family dehydratase [Rhodococcus fascians]
MKIFRSIDDIRAAVGESLGTSDWVDVTQERINTFAAATGDEQWIHVDVERANAESPFGGPIAHGYLSLSLLPMLGWQIYKTEGAKMGVNYGSNRVRFPSPVPVDSRLRLHAVLKEVDLLLDGSVQMVVTQTLEIEGHPKPAVVAETVSRVFY